MSTPSAKKPKYSYCKQKNYYKPNKRQFLEVGQRGFLATCNFREKDCVREAYNVLNHYGDELYGPKEKDGAASTPDNDVELENVSDIADDLQKEIDASKATKQNLKGALQKRFQAVDTGATNCVFVRTTLPDPVELGARIVGDIADTREQKSRFLLRLVPVEVVCRANLADITSAGGELFDKYFLKEGSTFAIVFNKRYNNDLKREDVIHELAALVQSKNVKNRVDLKQAEKTILVEVIKGLCCLSVLDGYLKYKKYNLVELANAKENNSTEIKDGKENVKKCSEELTKETPLCEGNKTETELDKTQMKIGVESDSTNIKNGTEKSSADVTKESEIYEGNINNSQENTAKENPK